jgi:hypothetical protein
MRIKYSQHHPDPSLRGTAADLKPHIAEQVIGSGLAVAFPYANYRERLAAETAIVVAAAPPQAPVQWGIREALSNDPYSPRFVITKTSPTETLHFSTLPQDAPPGIKQRWNDLHATDAQLYKDRQEFLKRQAEHVEPPSIGPASVVDVAQALVIGKNGVKR